MKSCHILWSTQSGRAKACARRTKRILSEQSTLEIKDVGFPFDETPEPFIEWVKNQQTSEDDSFLLLFVSTTGDGEHCDSIHDTWKMLLQKSLPKDLFQGKRFALFCLGDRAYGPQFCAGGRKLAVRLLQLGMTRCCDVGYGDDNTPNGGVFRDLDNWLEGDLLPRLEQHAESDIVTSFSLLSSNPFRVSLRDQEGTGAVPADEECENPVFEHYYREYFQQSCPVTAYSYDSSARRGSNIGKCKDPPLQGIVLVNQRVTADDWEQDTRHIRIQLQAAYGHKSLASSEVLSYRAGDIATVLPFNSDTEVDRFLKVLPTHLKEMATKTIQIDIDEVSMNNSFVRWPKLLTFRGWLKHCADIHSLPEREDLRALSLYCCEDDDSGKAQSQKLRSLSETSEAALYADYILREKRSWADVLYDFESLRSPGSKLSIEALLELLPCIRTRDFSIASAPSADTLSEKSERFSIELCVAVVEGKTRLGRVFHGLCSEYLARMVASEARPSQLRIWIRPGSFGRLPLDLSHDTTFKIPILCVGAGTGVAPMRSLLQERNFIQAAELSALGNNQDCDGNDNILVFGSRKESMDYYYKDEWDTLSKKKHLRVITAFSRDQFQKIYVQKVLREADNGDLIVKHLLERHGALYIAGGPKMARAVKEEVVEVLAKVLDGGEKEANQFLNKLQRMGRFSIEAWS